MLGPGLSLLRDGAAPGFGPVMTMTSGVASMGAGALSIYLTGGTAAPAGLTMWGYGSFQFGLGLEQYRDALAGRSSPIPSTPGQAIQQLYPRSVAASLAGTGLDMAPHMAGLKMIGGGGGPKGGQAGGGAAAGAANQTAAEACQADDMVDIYRGVGSRHPKIDAARRGEAIPFGGHTDPERHNRGDTLSEFTSWSLDKLVAERFARQNGPSGVVLHLRVPRSMLRSTPDMFRESEVLMQGPVQGASTRVVQ